MKFRIDENLRIVANAMDEKKDIEIVSVQLFQKFVDAGIVEKDMPCCSGERFVSLIARRCVYNVCYVLADYLFGSFMHPINCDVFDAFCQLIIEE